MAAATNVAESRAGGAAGGDALPMLEADTHTRLNRSLGAFGLLAALACGLSFTQAARHLLLMPGTMPGALESAAHAVGAAASSSSPVSASLSPLAGPAAATVAALGLLQWAVAGAARPLAMLRALFAEVAGTPAHAKNFNAALYALLGAGAVVAGLSYMAAPVATLRAVFGAGAPVPAGAALMW